MTVGTSVVRTGVDDDVGNDGRRCQQSLECGRPGGFDVGWIHDSVEVTVSAYAEIVVFSEIFRVFH
jgi:hypothetical protein